MYDIFLAHSRRNMNSVKRVAADLADHGVDVWLETIDDDAGDAVQERIERGIAESRVFCFALSPSTVGWYYLHKAAFERAMFDMVAEHRQPNIIALKVQPLHEPINDRIAQFDRLDFMNRTNYAQKVKHLVDAVRGTGGEYSGIRWFTGLHVSTLGLPVGSGPTPHMASPGPSYRMRWNSGTVARVDVYDDGILKHYMEFDYDRQGRVVVSTRHSPHGSRSWAVVDAVWSYAYEPKRGARTTKTMRYVGEATARVVHYEPGGRATREDIVTDAGMAPDRDFPYRRKTFTYDADGNPAGERWFGADGAEIPAVT